MNRYTAFISYRHMAPDTDIAKKLHSMIETFGIPAAFKRASGRKRMGRVFRDQDELPLSSDLGDDIHRALEESDWLICICSPRYLASRWCLEEVRYFLSLGRRERILTVLVEGEPNESFPEALRFETVDGSLVEREPLAADVRAETLEASLKKLKKEKLRILAPILGVNYDDLRQRARRRRTRIIAAVTAAAFVLLSGFLGYAVLKNAEITRKNEEITAQNEQITEQNDKITTQNEEIIKKNDEITRKNEQITKERNEALIAESKWLSKSADEALEKKDRALSLLLSLEALPTDFENPERPVTEDALRALRSAILYNKGDSGYHAVATVEVPGLETYRGFDSGVVCFSRKVDGYLAVFDMTGEALSVRYPLSEEPINCFITDDSAVILVYPDRIVSPCGYDKEGNMLFDDYSMGYVKDENGKSVTDENGNFVKAQFADKYESFQKLVESDYGRGGGILLRKVSPYTVLSWYQIYNHRYRDYGDLINYLQDAVCLNTPNGNGTTFAVGGYMSSNLAHEPVALQIYVASLQSDAGPMYYDHEDVRMRYYLNPEMIAPYLFNKSLTLNSLAASKYGSILAAYGYQELCLWATDDSEMRAALNPEMIGKARICDVQFSPQEEALLCLRTDNGGLYLYDCEKNEIRLAIRLGLTDITGFTWSADGDKLLITGSDGVARILNAADGAIIQTLDCPFAVKEATYCGDHFLLLRNGDKIQIDEMKAAEEIELPLSRWLGDEPITSPGYSSGSGTRLGLSPDQSTLWILRNGNVTLYDAETAEIKYVIPLETTIDYSDPERMALSYTAQGPYVRLRMSQTYAYLYVEGLNCHGYVRVYDPNTGEELSNFRAVYSHTYQYKADRDTADRSEYLIIGDLKLNADDSLLLINPGKEGGGSTVTKDPCLFVYRTEPHEECWHIGWNGTGEDYGSILAAAADWTGDFTDFSMRGDFLSPSGSVLCCYSVYNSYPKKFYRAAFEVRDAFTGEVTAAFGFDEQLNSFEVLPDQNRIVAQTVENRILMLAADTGETLAAFDMSGKLKTVETDGAGIWLTCEGLTSSSLLPRAFVSYDGTVTLDPAGEPDVPLSADGRYGPYTFHAEKDGLYDMETGEQIMRLSAAEYAYLLSWNDGSKLLFRSGDYYVIIRYADPTELRDIALRILDGQTLTDAQKAKYFLQ